MVAGLVASMVAMAIVFRERKVKGSKIKRRTYSAKVHVWDEARKRLVWRKIGTGCTDEGKALGIATALENASGEARAGNMTRTRAEELVSMVLQLAGVPFTVGPSLQDFAGSFLQARMGNVTPSTARKYASHWTALQEWGAHRMGWPLDRWHPVLLTGYYKHLREKFSVTTANDHLRTLSMIFIRAEAAGHIRGNPVAMVEREGNDSVEKHPLTRDDTAKILRAMRGNLPWQCLTALGWNTGHRIDDLLQLTTAAVKYAGKIWTVTFAPKKKKGRGRVVVLPIPRYVAKQLKRLGDFKALHGADNRNGMVSTDFVTWMKQAGVDPLPVKRGPRTIHLKSFHSFRHAMVSRLTAAGVDSQVSRLVTDHDSKRAHQTYIHAEVLALDRALRLARRK